MKRAIPALITLASFLAIAACGDVEPVDPAGYAREVEEWRADRVAKLTAERGWLTLVGLYWLEPGENRIGTAEGDTVRFDPMFAPGELGSLYLEEKDGASKVRLVPKEGAGLLRNGAPAVERYLATDADPEMDILSVGDLEFFVIRREERIGIRARHPGAESAQNFTGLDYYPIDPAWRIEASFVPYTEPRTIRIPSIIGTSSESLVPGEVRFELHGRQHTLLPLSGGPDDPNLFYIFRDKTSGSGTYPAGRFLVSEAASEGKVVIDFNRAYNPPCAFTPYATCPLPPKENWLTVPVEAGEKDYGSH
jgi:uncharacterized protein (DUF1684 family)